MRTLQQTHIFIPKKGMIHETIGSVNRREVKQTTQVCIRGWQCVKSQLDLMGASYSDPVQSLTQCPTDRDWSEGTLEPTQS